MADGIGADRAAHRRARQDVGGPDAPRRATEKALAAANDARAIVLVEGISDQTALERLAMKRGRYLAGEGIVVVPTGGAHTFGRYLGRFGPHGANLRLAGLCDAAEEGIVRRELSRNGVGTPRNRRDMERLGFFVCVDDLEDELLRAVGTKRAVELFRERGDLRSFRTLQMQPDWRHRPVEAQMRRFLGSGARRKLRYARVLVDAFDPGDMPEPLAGVLASV